VNLIKNIPVFSGLVGGTSNAAFVLKFFLKDRITKNILNKVEKLIGSDLRLFFYKKGFLENLKNIKIIKTLLIDIYTKKGCYFSRMSGSGSVCYGIFNNESNAEKALNKIKTKYPKFWFSLAKTV
jgi:4-diphosphocytidyl-2C-methyl-D-erythritol kinase